MHPLINQYQYTLLGRLRINLLTGLSGSRDKLPTQRQVYAELMDNWKENALAARIKFFLPHLTKTDRRSFPVKLSPQQIKANIKEIADKPALWAVFSERSPDNERNGPSLGCLVMGHTRPSNEPGYYAAILSEENFPNCGFLSIVSSRRASDCYISQLGHHGWEEMTFAEAGENPNVCMALTTIHRNLPGTITVPIEEIRTRPEDKPPRDPEFMRRLNLIFRGKMRTAKATVSLDHIRLFDANFGRSLEAKDISSWATHLQTDDDDLLVYWDGRSFVSSDDYYGYLGYQMLGRQHVSVVIMGEFPSTIAKVERRGKHKLLPPVRIGRESVTPGITKEFRSWQATDRKQREDRLPTPADLLAQWSTFADLLSEHNPTEKQLHEFLASNPISLGAHWDEVKSEVWFGRRKADLLLRAHRALPTVRLVELERPTHRLFTNDLHETDEVTHAVQQVSDWLRWCRQHPEDPVIAAGRGVTPDGIVVIGRSRFLSEQEREILAHNNQGREVKVVTYDELLDDFSTLILHRLDDTDPKR